MQQIADWLNTLGLGQYAQPFAENDIDPSVLRDLTDHDLEKIGVSLGHRRKILRAIAELDEAGPRPAPSPRPEAERRQLTVMFADLVGSTALSTRLILRTCGKSLARTTDAVPSKSRNLAGSSPDTWATACSHISAIRGRMKTMLSARYTPGWHWSRPWRDSMPARRQDCECELALPLVW